VTQPWWLTNSALTADEIFEINKSRFLSHGGLRSKICPFSVLLSVSFFILNIFTLSKQHIFSDKEKYEQRSKGWIKEFASLEKYKIFIDYWKGRDFKE